MLNQIVIVEGKTDTAKLKKIFGDQIQTIETNGLALNLNTINLIKKLSKNNQIIIFTDPDGPGKRIREKIISEIDTNIFNAFINKNSFNKNSKKIGIAEADEAEIKNALRNLLTFNKNNNSISWNDYVDNDFYLKVNRVKITKKLNINFEISSKTLFKWLNWMQLSKKDIEEVLGN